MASVVEICNRALQKLGAARITSLTQDSVEARACNACYEVLRDAELRAHTWSFAITRATLAADAFAPDWGRTNAFQLPTDFLRVADDYPEDLDTHKDWLIEGRQIVTDDGDPIYLRYVKKVTDPNEMDPLFRELLSTKMAEEMCEALTQSNVKKDGLKVDYDKILAKAKKANAIELQSADAPEDDWLLMRN